MRLLCVEDDRVNALLLEQSCRAAGVSAVLMVESGAEAVALAPEFAPDLLVIDLYLPDTDGYALLAALRHALQSPSVPAVLCTSSPPETVAAAAGAAGFAGVWSKPVPMDEVRGTLDGMASR